MRYIKDNGTLNYSSRTTYESHCVRWVPRMLSEENITNRTEASRQFLRKFSQSGIGFLDRIITTDETWFHYYDPETKQQCVELKGDYVEKS